MTDQNALIEQVQSGTLVELVAKASRQLAQAQTAAEVMDAQRHASDVYDAAKKAARVGRAKKAHDDLIARAHRAQADALLIESEAKRRLADEYDAAQQRGEVQGLGGDMSGVTSGNTATAADIGLSRKQIHEARQIRDAEKKSPGITERAVEGMLQRGEEPTKAAVRREVNGVVIPSTTSGRQWTPDVPTFKKPKPVRDLHAYSESGRDDLDASFFATHLRPEQIPHAIFVFEQRGDHALAQALSKIGLVTQDRVASDFDAFWELYPHKVGKPVAEKAFAGALRKPGVSPARIMNGLARYVTNQRADHLWLNPSSFLNQERYDDQPAPSPMQRDNRNDFTSQFNDELDRLAAEYG